MTADVDPIAALTGVPIQVVQHFGNEYVQYRFPKSKSRRIRKKWRKNPKNWGVRNQPVCFKTAQPNGPPKLVMSPSYFARLKRHMKRKEVTR
jgi:hypothetical protein